jgi:DNA polymerase-1
MTREGTYSTKADHIKPLIALPGEAGYAAALRLEYQGLSKYESLYTTGLIELAAQAADGRLHTSYQQVGTDTGRFSSAFPNISNIPDKAKVGGMPSVRAAFVAPDEWVCVARDLSQAELRQLAHFSQDPKLLKAYRSDEDIHAMTMAKLGIERTPAKVTNFSCIYRISARALAVKLTFFTGRRYESWEAQELIDGFFGLYDRVSAYHAKAIRVAEERGYARTIGGFRMPLPASEWQSRRHFTENRAINYPIQGSVATMLKRCLVTLYREWSDSGVLGERVLIQGQTYDSINVLARTDFAEQANDDMRRVMEGCAPELTVPLRSDGGIGRSWAEAK